MEAKATAASARRSRRVSCFRCFPPSERARGEPSARREKDRKKADVENERNREREREGRFFFFPTHLWTSELRCRSFFFMHARQASGGCWHRRTYRRRYFSTLAWAMALNRRVHQVAATPIRPCPSTPKWTPPTLSSYRRSLISRVKNKTQHVRLSYSVRVCSSATRVRRTAHLPRGAFSGARSAARILQAPATRGRSNKSFARQILPVSKRFAKNIMA